MNMDTFAFGVKSMASNCLFALGLVKDGKWTPDQMEQWLKAVRDNDAAYVKTAQEMIANK